MGIDGFRQTGAHREGVIVQSWFDTIHSAGFVFLELCGSTKVDRQFEKEEGLDDFFWLLFVC